MSLNRKQVEFTRTMARFLCWCFDNDIEVIGAEWYRTREQAEIYAKQGKGIKNSVHTKKLAVDLFRFKGGKVSWDREDYREMAEKWVSMHPDARAGYYFKNRDAVHFSFEHRGVK